MFEKKSDTKPDYFVNLKSIAQFLTVGQYTRNVPGKPQLPSGGDENLLIAFPRDLSRVENQIVWILCKDTNELKYRKT